MRGKTHPFFKARVFGFLVLLSLGNHALGVPADHSLFIKTDGSLHVMGRNSYGQLGIGLADYNNHPTPEQIEASGVIQVVGGSQHTLFIKSDGSLWAVGGSGNGQLGNGGTTQQDSPVQIEASGVMQVAAGKHHSLFIKSDGSLWAMGSNGNGQLGTGNTTQQLSPVEILSSGAAQVAAGEKHSLILKTDGSLHTMGYNIYGQLGTGNTTQHDSPVEILASGVAQIGAGLNHSLFVKTDGSLHVMGQNFNGQLGTGNTTQQLSPVEILASGVTQVVGGSAHSLFVKSDGSLHGMGRNNYGQLGNGGTTEQTSPVQIYASGVAQVTAGDFHSLLLKTDGSLHAMGYNQYGKLGIGVVDFDNHPNPEQILASGVMRLSEIGPIHFAQSAANLEMLWCPPGTFTMGSPTSETGRGPGETEHNVTLTKGFYLGKYEVTQAQYEAVMTGNVNSLSATPSQFPGNPTRPVELVSWDDAQIFLARLNAAEQTAGRLPSGWSYVLPTEAEWEYACRAGTTTAYSWGNTIASSNANYGSNIGQTRDVGQYAANPWGLFDMHGNVYEWTADWYQAAYPTGNPVVDPTGPASGSARVTRGGAWNHVETNLRSAWRFNNTPSNRYNNLGFRLAYRQITTPPTNLNPTAPLTIAENQPIGTVVGEFNATDPDVNATLTYQFVSGAGDGNNSLFTLETNGTLKTATTFDFESNASTFSIRVKVKDEHNASMENNFTVTLTNANDPPTGAVTISGTPVVGQTLTASNDLADGDGLGAITYQWFRDGLPIIYGATIKDGVNGVDGLSGASGIILSPDGKHAYVMASSDNSISSYERNASTGLLTYLATLKDGVNGVDGLNWAWQVASSADGKHVYATGSMDNAVSWYERNSSTGVLTYGGMVKDGNNGVDGLFGASDVVVSADGKHVYATGLSDNAVSWYDRNSTTGALTFGGVLKDNVGGVDGLAGARKVTLSPDGNHAYVTSETEDAVVLFDRNSTSGALTYVGLVKDAVGGVDGLNGARGVIVSADGAHLYASGDFDDAVSWFERNASTGALTYGGVVKDGTNGVDGLNEPYFVTLSSDAKHAYVSGYTDDALSWYDRNSTTGALTYGGMLKDGINGVDGLNGASVVALSPDGKFAYVTGYADNTVSMFTRDPLTGALSYGSASDANYTLTAETLGSVITVVASYTDGGTFDHNVSSGGTASIQPVYNPSQPNHLVDLNSTVNLEMIWVEPGSFTMGSPDGTGNSNETEHNVTFTQGFYLGKYVVTQAQYEAVMTGNTNGLSATPSQYSGNPTRPVEKVSLEDAQVFLSVLNDAERQAGRLPNGWAYVLPTESQWEYACRAGTTTLFSWGNDYVGSSLANFNWDGEWNTGNDAKETVDVGLYASSPWGFHDMHGNVWEWVTDWYGYYPSSPVTDPTGPASGTNRVARGGAWGGDPYFMRSAQRYSVPSQRNSSIGFRLAYKKITNLPADLNATAPMTIAENQPIGTVVGEFNATDPDVNATLTYHLVSGAGDGNNSLFTLETNGTLKTATTFDFESNASTYSIRVQVKDEFNASAEGNFTITLSNVNDAPVITQGAGPLAVTMSEDGSPTAWVAPTLGATDAETADSALVWSISSAATNGTATVTGTAAAPSTFTYAPAADYFGSDSFVVQVTDGILTDSITVNVTVTATNDPPTDLNTTAPLTIAENQPVGTVVGEFNATDPDAGATLTYQFVSGAGDGNNTLFTLETNGTLKTATIFDYESNASSYALRVQAKDEHNATVEGNFTVTLTDVPEYPIYLGFDGNGSTQKAVAEKTMDLGLVLFTDSTDQNLTYSINGTDANWFEVNASTGAFRFKGYPVYDFPLDQGADNVYDLNLSATNDAGLQTNQPVTVSVSDANSTNWVFTNAAATGKDGPTQTQVDQAYLGTNLEGKVISLQGIQQWSPPKGGDYYVRAFGGAGSPSGANRGRGALIGGKLSLEQNDTVILAVGQMGTSTAGPGGGGGGGSFFVVNGVPKLIAGGGGGHGGHKDSLNSSAHAPVTQDGLTSNGSHLGGTQGNGGAGADAGGGGGFSTDGVNGSQATGGKSFLNGATGGYKTAGNYGGDGGFGGGGGGKYKDGNLYGSYHDGGGGGGYSGGSGGVSNVGGGGGSYNLGGFPLEQAGHWADHGTIIVTLLTEISIPSDLNATAPLTIAENQPIGTVVGALNAKLRSEVPVSIFAGDGKSYAVMKDGTMRSWGGNWSGALGDGTETQRNLPGPVNGLSGVRMANGVSGFSVAVLEDGTVWTWGNNSHGQLGDGTTSDRSLPGMVNGFAGVRAVAGGSAHALALKEDGTVWAWGKNDFGQLGDGSTQDRGAPVQVSGLSGVVMIKAGREQSFSLALTSLGEVWTWGQNQQGQLGDGSVNSSNLPKKVATLSGITEIAAGSGFSLALKNDGTVWWWGALESENSVTPVQVSDFDQVVALGAGRYHAMAVRADGSLWTWGYNGHGALGDGTTTNRLSPVQVVGLDGVSMVDGAYRHSLALKADGTVWAWGSDNNYGAFGNGTSSSSQVPVQANLSKGQTPEIFNYTLVSGVGDTHNSLFTLETNGTLKTATIFDYESNASTYSIRVQAGDEHNGTVEGNFTVTLTDLNDTLPAQIITWNQTLGSKTYGDPDMTLNATAGSSLPVAYASSNVAVVEVNGTKLVIVGAGSATVTASQAGNALWQAAPSVDKNVTVAKANQYILSASNTTTLPNWPNKKTGDFEFDPGAKSVLATGALSGLTVTYSSSDTNVVSVVSGNTRLNPVGAGTATITASQVGNAGFNPATSRTFTVSVSGSSLSLSSFSASLTIAENQPIGTVVGEFNATGPDANSTLTYHFDSGAGDGNNSLFTLDANGTLKTSVVLDHESNASLSVRIRASDEHGASVGKIFTVTVTDGFAPIVGTHPQVESVSGGYRLSGEIQDSGGAVLHERGFLLSPKPNPKADSSGVIRLIVDSNASAFSAHATNLQASKKYFFRAYATNSEGTGYGLEESFGTTFVPRGPSWIVAVPGTANNWWSSPWWGSFYLNANGWARHEKLGWVFPIKSPTAGLWLWKEGFGWLWTNEEIYPFLYQNGNGGWLYFFGRREGTLLFYDYSTKRWITRTDG